MIVGAIGLELKLAFELDLELEAVVELTLVLDFEMLWRNGE